MSPRGGCPCDRLRPGCAPSAARRSGASSACRVSPGARRSPAPGAISVRRTAAAAARVHLGRLSQACHNIAYEVLSLPAQHGTQMQFIVHLGIWYHQRVAFRHLRAEAYSSLMSFKTWMRGWHGQHRPLAISTLTCR